MRDGSAKAPHELTAAQASAAIRQGTLTSEQLVRSCLAHIEARDPVVKAWIAIDPARAIAAAREADKRAPIGPLHGIPFGVKDMIDTVELPTTYNSPLFPGHRPARDAACVSVMRSSGAIMLGKTDTVEFASHGRVAATRHPLHPTHTPGGSSSGSGAAVGDLQVPLAFGTQTGGSLIRPASFNGIHAFKPSWGAVSREGAKLYSTSLDTIGWYGRSVDDLRLMAQAFRLHEPAPERKRDPRKLRIGVCRSPQWSRIEAAGALALETAAERLRQAGVVVETFDLPSEFDELQAAQRHVMRGEGRSSFLPLHLEHREKLHPALAGHVEGDAVTQPHELVAAYRLADRCRAAFDGMFEHIDAILTPASAGAAPEGLASTGDPSFNSMWTLLHAPCVAIPCIADAIGLPVGIQLVRPRWTDGALLDVATALGPIIENRFGDA